MSSKKSSEQFEKELIIAHPNLKLVGLYKNSSTKVVVEDELGILYKVKPSHVLSGMKPSLMTALDPTKGFIIMSNKLHGDKYTYEKCKYINTSTKVIITCKKHGDFNQKPMTHLHRLYGCRKCANENHPGVMASIAKYNPNKLGYMYLMMLENSEGFFYKVGLTIVSPEKRLKDFRNLKSKKVISSVKGDIGKLYPIEQEYHKKFKELNLNYCPKELSGNGATECFK